MSLDSKSSAKNIFLQAIKIESAKERSAFLVEACSDDSELRNRVDALIVAHESPESLLDKAAPRLSVDEMAPTVGTQETENPGTQIGPYKIREQIGEGGMGVVYVAEQEKPLRRKVALKVIKPGMDSKAVLARFEAERNALALMNHPNIARVLDAGTTEYGHPYFVMELIQGQSITEYCDQKKLTIEQRLGLFAKICNAVQHAHQKGVVHRDIKPSNILVTEIDGKPVPKVIDFGVAKALGANLTDRTVYTSFQALVGTPLYMSPEQTHLSGVDVDTSSDVYSLGILLYEMLTGTTPLSPKDLKQAAQDEVLRRIRETEPPRPSERISSLGKTSSKVSECRGTQTEQLGRMLRGDLDWIVMKALEKDRNRRFRTADAFATDIGKYLANEPVEARPPSAAYRASKFIRRNRSAVGIAVLLALVLLTSTVVASRGWIKAAQKERELRSLLSELQGQVIERALSYAMSGELHENHLVLDEAKEVGVSDEWLLALEGIELMHRGKNEEAINVLTRAEKDNLAARAMLSLALFHTGRWDEWARLVNELVDAEPREEFSEFDELCLGYAYFYIDFEQSAQILQRVLERHPTWIVPRGVLANASSHSALNDDSHGRAHAEEAIREIEFVWRFAGENPFVLLHSLSTYNQARSILGPDSERDKRALGLAGKLEQYPEYAVGGLVRAIFYERLERPEKAREAWDDLLGHGQGVVLSWGFAELSRAGDFERIRKQKCDEIEGRILRAYALALSPHEVDRQVARDEYAQLRDQANSWFLRYLVVQIPLMLQEPKQATRQCKQWATEDTSDPDAVSPLKWEKQSILWIANREQGGKWNPDPSDPVETFFAKFQQGMVAYANRDQTELVKLFQDLPSPGRGSVLSCWARTLIETLPSEAAD